MVSGAVSALVRGGLIAGSGSLIVLAAAGCGASGHAASSGTTKAATASPTRTTASPSPSVTLDGAALNSLLLPTSAMPAGYRLIPSSSRNAEQSLPQDMPQSVPASQVCDLLNNTGWLADGGISAADFAQNAYGNSSKTEEVDQEIDVFQPGDAEKVMSRLWLVFGHCQTFTLQANGTTTSVSLNRARLAGVGDEAIKAVYTAPLFLGGTTLVAIRVGDAIVTCLDSSNGSDLGAGGVTIAERIAQRVRTAQQAG